MNAHFAEDEILRWIAGERSDDRAEHLRGCPGCAARVGRLGGALGEFREAVHGWGEAQLPAFRPAAKPRRFVPVLRWAAAAAALVMIAAVPAYRQWQEEARREEMARDATLLEQVDAEVSEAVPTSMQPLVSLVSWDSSTTEKGDVR